MNFQNLLLNLAKGDEPDLTSLVTKRKNGPPVQQLLPSEQALTDMHAGADLAHGASEHQSSGGAGKAALGGALQGLQNITQPTNFAPEPFTQGNPLRERAIGLATQGIDDYRGLQYGGEVQDGETVTVGEDGEETVKKTPDGRVLVFPNAADAHPRGGGYTTPQGPVSMDTPEQSTEDDDIVGNTAGWGSPPAKSLIQRDIDLTPPSLNQQLQDAMVIKKGSAWKNFGAALIQGVDNSLNHKNNPVRSYDEIKRDRKVAALLPRIQLQNQQAKMEQDSLDNAATRRLKEAQAGYYDQRPGIEQNKVDARTTASSKNNLTRQYNSLPSYSENDPDDQAFGDVFAKEFGYRPLEKNAETKSEQLTDQRNGQVYIIQTDKQGGRKIIKLTKDDDTPFTIETKEQLASGDKAKQRELQKLIADGRNVTAVRAAEINAGSRKDVANINQAGATARLVMKNPQQATLTLAAIPNHVKPIKGESPDTYKQRQRDAQKAFWNSLSDELKQQIPDPAPVTMGENGVNP